MTYEIKITDQADNDIRNIYEYIACELQSPENAKGQLDRIKKAKGITVLSLLTCHLKTV